MDSGRSTVRKAIQFSWQITGMLLAVLWLFQTPLWAAIYKWRDDQGKLHFTDSKSKIPLKYRNQVEKFKGVTEPAPKSQPSPSSNGGQGSGNGETEAKLEEGVKSEPAEKAKKPPEKPKYSKKEIALLNSVKIYMTRTWANNVRLIEHIPPTKINGKYYISSSTKAATKKKNIIRKIGGSPIASLKETKKFLKKSIVNDTMVNTGDPPFMEKVQKIRKIIEADIPQQKALIDQLTADLGEHDETPVE
jgi:cytoskeletal protein RodZ